MPSSSQWGERFRVLSPQRHRDTKGAGAIEDDSGTDNEIKRRISMSVPRLLRRPLCLSVFVVPRRAANIMKMKAAILETLRAPLVIDEIEIPALQCGQVLAKIHRTSICGAQLGEIDGRKGEDKFLPHLLGHEGGGVVLETGPGVTHVRRGDHVVLHWRKGPGIQASTAKYDWNGRTVNSGWVTTFNEYTVVSENRLTPIPKDVPFEIAALMGCAVTTALGVINNLAQLKIGQSIAVFGCGGVGLNVVQG